MKSVLIIDDDNLFGTSLKQELSDHNYESKYIEDPQEIENVQQEFDIVLIDLRLKNASGLNYINEIKLKWPQSQVILMTGFGTIATAVNAIKLGASDYLTKPVTIKKFEAILNKDAEINTEDTGQDDPMSLDRVEREYIEHILVQEKGNISKAAEKLGLHRQSLQRKLKKWVPFK
jgi:two-component system response regulator RegA